MNILEHLIKYITEWTYIKSIGYSVVEVNSDKESPIFCIHFSNLQNTRSLGFCLQHWSANSKEEYFISASVRCLNCKNVKYIDFSFSEYLEQKGRKDDFSIFKINFPNEQFRQEIILQKLNQIETLLKETEINDILVNGKWYDQYFYEFR